MYFNYPQSTLAARKLKAREIKENRSFKSTDLLNASATFLLSVFDCRISAYSLSFAKYLQEEGTETVVEIFPPKLKSVGTFIILENKTK